MQPERYQACCLLDVYVETYLKYFVHAAAEIYVAKYVVCALCALSGTAWRAEKFVLLRF